MGNKSSCILSNPSPSIKSGMVVLYSLVFTRGNVTESSSWLYNPKVFCVDLTKAVANLKKALQSSYNLLVAADIPRPASSVCRTWLNNWTSSWLCDAIEWAKTTRKGAKEEKSNILLKRRLNSSYLTQGCGRQLTSQNILSC
jgi:hypothetical protein